LRCAALLLPLVLLPVILSSAQPCLILRAEPSELVVNPGDEVRMRIIIRNACGAEVNLTGFELRVLQYLPPLPSGIQVGVYEMPLERPISLMPGEEREIKRVFEVPRVAYSGDFSIILKARSTAGESETEVSLSLGLPLSSAISAALLVSIEAGVIYGIYRALLRRVRPEHMISRRLRRLRSVRGWREYDEEVVNLLDERRSWGTLEDGLRYERHVRAIMRAEKLISMVLNDLRESERRLEREIEVMRWELAALSGRVSERSLRYVRRLIDERERMLRDLASLVREVGRSAGAQVPL